MGRAKSGSISICRIGAKRNGILLWVLGSKETDERAKGESIDASRVKERKGKDRWERKEERGYH